MSLWFAVFATYETLIAQLIAAILVIGSYYAARRFGHTSPLTPAPEQEAEVEAGEAVEELEAAR